MGTVLAYPTVSELAQAAAGRAVADLSAAVAEYGNATWVIAGGSSPVAAYKVLAASSVGALDWSKVSVVIGDERCVPFDSPESNWSQAYGALLRFLPLDPAVARPRSDLPADEAARQYDAYLRTLPTDGAGLPRLDHVWLGMGEDGHTLSLFPGHPSSLEPAGGTLVIPVYDSPKPPSDRISLSFDALRGAKSCVVLAAGSGKAEAVRRALAGDTTLPIARAVAQIGGEGGTVAWLLDSAAASQ